MERYDGERVRRVPIPDEKGWGNGEPLEEVSWGLPRDPGLVDDVYEKSEGDK